MKKEFPAILDSLAETKLAENPNFIFMMWLAQDERINYPKALVVAASIKINVNRNFIADKELVDKTLTTYTKCLNEIWAGLLLKGFSYEDTVQAFLTLVKTMSLEYTF